MFSGEIAKARARQALKDNFWRCVLVGLILVIFCNNTYRPSAQVSTTANVPESSAQTLNGLSLDSFIDTDAIVNGTGEAMTAADAVQNVLSTTGHGIFNYMVRVGTMSVPVAGIMAVIALILEIFVFNMLKIGGAKFFIENADSPDTDAMVLLDPFRNGRLNSMAAIMLLKDLQIMLYSLLLVIPGIIKAYELRLVPYLLAENPDLDYKTAFAQSKELMMDSKWAAFMLDLSFFGWKILKILTYNLSGIFWSDPYEYAANAEMYIQLCALHMPEEDEMSEYTFEDAEEQL